ncbi:unnamed protein product [Ranitomeya imitator]|uniref:Kelch repeat protein n=1 Tax=Ranitomeya imitator TaxID=111125 RepID=A0ABN9MGA9_9NEOB|nr:unnamed protein product [Ranitomeya imitator]
MFTLVTGIVGRWRAVCVTALQRPNSDAAAIRIVVGIAAASLSVTINTWTPIANMLSRRSSAGVAVLEGMLYVAGGNDGTSCLNSVERYNPKANTWESVAPMNIRR